MVTPWVLLVKDYSMKILREKNKLYLPPGHNSSYTRPSELEWPSKSTHMATVTGQVSHPCHVSYIECNTVII